MPRFLRDVLGVGGRFFNSGIGGDPLSGIEFVMVSGPSYGMIFGILGVQSSLFIGKDSL